MASVPSPNGPEKELEKNIGEMTISDKTDSLPHPLKSNAVPPQEPPSDTAPIIGTMKMPIAEPLESSKPAPSLKLKPEEQKKYDQVLETVKSWKEVPSKVQGKTGPLIDDEIMWLSRECILRYLRATKWSVAEASKRLLATLTWRREYGVEEHSADYISEENETGKQLILGYDNEARPCLYLNPGRQNTAPNPKQVEHLVFMLERVVDLMCPGQETLALLINFKATKSKNNVSPPLSQSREVLNILQTHYPERLGRALIINIPWIVWGFFKLITPFIDPLTKEKLKFNEDLRLQVPPQHLWKEFQGDLEFDYEHSVYWPALNKLCEARRTARRERWVEAGKHYGESENYMKGGGESSIGGATLVKTD